VSNAGGLCVLAPVAAGREDALRTHLRALPPGPRSPMIRVVGTHYARWAIVRLEDRDGWPLESEPPYLLFAAEFDGERDGYARRLCERLAHDAHDIWMHCEGYPGPDDDALAAFLLAHHVPPGYSVNAYPDATVDRVRAAFALRERLADFLIRAGSLEGEALKRAWEARFRGGRR
jgi:hypothetical protein